MDDEHEDINSAQHFPPPDEVVANIARSHPSRHAQTEATTPQQEKQVRFDEQTGKITAQIIPARKSSIPDIAPPPYSASANGTSAKAVPEGDQPTQARKVSERPTKVERPKKQSWCSAR
jgi:hypothetical protein